VVPVILRRHVSPKSVLRLGFLLLVAASLGRFFLRPGPGLSEGLSDGLQGLLYGLTIGTFVVGMWLDRRARTSRRG
jgi:MFS-type transporter involved in bile tolerance (Atg22 family)